MASQRTLFVAGVACVAGVVAAGAVWWQLNRVSLENDPITFSIRESVPRYAALATIDPADTAGVREAIERCETLGLQPIGSVGRGWIITHADMVSEQLKPESSAVTEPMRDQLTDQVAELILTRFMSDDPGTYLAHRASHGATLPDPAGLEASLYTALDDIVRFQYGREPTEQDTVRSVFDHMFLKHRDDGSFRLEAIKAGDGIAIAFGIHDGQSATANLDASALGYVGWYGGISHTYGVWTVPERRAAGLVEAYGPLIAAEVGIVMRFGTGNPRPLILSFVWNPSREDWQLETASITNYVPADGRDGAPVF